MTEPGFALFDTPIGRCGIVWGPRGIAALQLPEARESATRARLLERAPDAQEAPPPQAVAHAIGGIVAMLRGEASDLGAVALDMADVPPFHRRVYEAARRIAPGTTLSYGELAALVAAPGAARAVGQALRRNPFAILVPCHRVLAAGGRIGGFSADGGIATKLRLLALEAAHAEGAAPLFAGDGHFGFDAEFALDYLRDADPALARLIAAVGPFRMQIKPAPSLFLALAEAMVYQQVTGRAAATIFARLKALFPHGRESPTAAQLLRTRDAPLRAAGLSRAKILALRDLAQKTIDGAVPTLAQANDMENEALIERLTEIRGIGRWTVEMLLIFRLGRPDVLPLDDYGVRKGFAYMLRKRALPSRQEMARRGARWSPYRSVASWYLWRGSELAARRERARR